MGLGGRWVLRALDDSLPSILSSLQILLKHLTEVVQENHIGCYGYSMLCSFVVPCGCCENVQYISSISKLLVLSKLAFH